MCTYLGHHLLLFLLALQRLAVEFSYIIFMPIKLLVSSADDLATVRGPVLFVTPVGHPLVLSLFVCQALGIRKFLPWQFPYALA